jgi:hypothetical protein
VKFAHRGPIEMLDFLMGYECHICANDQYQSLFSYIFFTGLSRCLRADIPRSQPVRESNTSTIVVIIVFS